MRIDLLLNGQETSWEIAPGSTLLAALRQAGTLSVKRGCETGDCGSCTVLLDEQPVNSCVVMAARAAGCSVTTIEGLANDEVMQQLQKALVDAAAVQCGYCSPGMLISLYVLMKEGQPVGETEIREALSGNLCRCTGYVKPVEAACKIAENLEGQS